MPTVPEALQIGWKRHQQGDLRGAEDVYRQVLRVAPGDANAWCFLGMACHDQQRFDEAEQAYETALRLQPNFPVALSNLGNTLKQQGKLEQAEASCRAALRLKPDYSTAHNNLGVALVAQGRLAEAAETFERALSLMPNDAVTHANLSAALVRQGKFTEAEAKTQAALRLNPNYAEAHKNQGIVWLLLGDFERGWPEYEWRWRCPGSALPRYPQPMWAGESLEGKTILTYAEQGLGDTIQFIRYAHVLRDLGARVIARCQAPLHKLLSSCSAVDLLQTLDDPVPAFDTHVPLMSVPGILKTTFESIPGDTPYLAADADLIRLWAGRLAAYAGLKVGIAWQGSKSFHADAQRSIPLKSFLSLAAAPGVTLFSLQKGYGAEQIEQLGATPPLVDFGEDLDSRTGPFMDTAAIMANLDLVITSDTSIAHLAGALGRPTWVALPLSPDWRWFLERDDSPWYPETRLFRQTRLGHWDDVFESLANALRDLASRGGEPTTASTGASPSNEASTNTSLSNLKRRTESDAMVETTISVEVAPGELIDKITILEIKSERMSDAAKVENVRLELITLQSARDASIPRSAELDDLTARLKEVNERLWVIEDEIRDCERDKNFGPRFIELARAVYKTNDRRAALKREISQLLGSRLLEEKSYAEYE